MSLHCYHSAERCRFKPWSFDVIMKTFQRTPVSANTLPPSHTSLAGIAGRVITPDDPVYNDTRAVFYGGIDKRPSAIARVTNAEDIRRVIETARNEGYEDRKSTRLNSSHGYISYAVFCLKKKNNVRLVVDRALRNQLLRYHLLRILRDDQECDTDIHNNE